MEYKKLNNIGGWICFTIAAIVYLSTIEPTTSFWDCGEYIVSANKLEVGHPPGAPTFMMIGRVFSAFGSPENAAMLINAMSAICSAFTILFLFWTITYLSKKIILKNNKNQNLTDGEIYAILGSGLVGALAYTFSDTFWFSAVEGEVYAMSSMATAITFWAVFKWENVAHTKYGDRWLIFIAYLIGLSIGVHLLNLLVIPSLTYIYYFKKFKTINLKGLLITGALSIVLLGAIQNLIIPGLVELISGFELFFVNTLGMPFNSGSIIYALLLIAAIVAGLKYTQKKNYLQLNTAILCFTVLVIGYSSFGLILIRSSANPPMDQNNPENSIRLLSYLNRDQYGSVPVFYGHYFNAPLDNQKPYKDGGPVYYKDKEKGKYVISDDRKQSIPNYAKEFCTIFPRMPRGEKQKVQGYKTWTEFEGTPIPYKTISGETQTINKPKFWSENISYFINYQVIWMYWRYFMWNFTGRQNDIQGHGNAINGNWMSGIGFLDEWRLGPQTDLPSEYSENKGKNTYFFFPLILGLLGLFFHFKQDNKSAFAVFLLFIFTGLAIIIYLNQGSYEPRERDYAFAASFYAFAVWLGIGVLFLYNITKNLIKTDKVRAIATTLLCVFAVPALMASQNWDDHDRSNRTLARAIAMNYLDSCQENAILFCMGDNDTFPLWYMQEVEGYRTDVRVVNLSYLSIDWYIEQMHMKAYDAQPLPLSFKPDQYRQGTRDLIRIIENEKYKNQYIDAKTLIKFIQREDAKAKIDLSNGDKINYLPTKRFSLPVNKEKVLKNGIVAPEQANQIVDKVEWQVNKAYLTKSETMLLDILAQNNWERPIHFTSTIGRSGYFGLTNYFQLDGYSYRLLPVKSKDTGGLLGSVNTNILYDNLVNKFHWGGLDTHPDLYIDNTIRTSISNLRLYYLQLGEALFAEGKNEKALTTINLITKNLPHSVAPHSPVSNRIAALYFNLGEKEKAATLATEILEINRQKMNYFLRFDADKLAEMKRDMEFEMSAYGNMLSIAKRIFTDEEKTAIENDFSKIYERYKTKMTLLAAHR